MKQAKAKELHLELPVDFSYFLLQYVPIDTLSIVRTVKKCYSS
jgi:hypothetical protein